MDNSGIDGGRVRRKTWRVPLTPEERSLVGLALKKERENREWKQPHVAEKLNCSVGTVQAIEYNKYRVDRDTVDQYAALFGKTVHDLLHPESTPPPPAGVLVTDLNREHLAIARSYMRAVKAVRTAVESLLADTPASTELTEEIADVVNALKQAAEDEPQIAYWTTFVLEHGDVLVDIAKRLSRDPLFEERLRDFVDDEPPSDSTPTNTKRKPK